MHWDVKTVQVLSDYKLAIELVDGQRGVFDLSPFLSRPGLQRLNDPAYFSLVEVRLGALTWPHEEDIAPDTLAAHLEATAAA